VPELPVPEPPVPEPPLGVAPPEVEPLAAPELVPLVPGDGALDADELEAPDDPLEEPADPALEDVAAPALVEVVVAVVVEVAGVTCAAAAAVAFGIVNGGAPELSAALVVPPPQPARAAEIRTAALSAAVRPRGLGRAGIRARQASGSMRRPQYGQSFRSFWTS